MTLFPSSMRGVGAWRRLTPAVARSLAISLALALAGGLPRVTLRREHRL